MTLSRHFVISVLEIIVRPNKLINYFFIVYIIFTFYHRNLETAVCALMGSSQSGSPE